MRDGEKYCCPNPDCNFIGFNDDDCPECGVQLEKIKGDDYMNSDYESGGAEDPMMVEEFDDDPEAVSWYIDSEEPFPSI